MAGEFATDVAQSHIVSPYRAPAPALLCPRCLRAMPDEPGEISTCSLCHGVWLPARAISQWFGDDDWPRGTSMWWRSRAVCPRCAQIPGGEPQVMLVRNVGGVLIDRCARHGVWLDAGEVGRLVAEPGVGDAEVLQALRARIEVAPRPGHAGAVGGAVSAAGDDEHLALEREVAALQAEVYARRQELADLERMLDSKRSLLANDPGQETV